MSKQKLFGKCALCGKECELTFEHIPPRSAFNDHPVKTVSLETMLNNRHKLPWDFSGLQYKNNQQGMGGYTLCSTCNNNTGSWYGDAYTYVANTAQEVMLANLPDDVNAIDVDNVYPLRFVKQIISMFCSLNPTQNMDDLRQFVLNKEAVGIDKTKYRLTMFFTKSTISRTVPYSIKVLTGLNFSKSIYFSELVVPPLGFILYFGLCEDIYCDGMDITGLSDNKYDDKAKIRFPLCVLDVNHYYPTDYRTKDEIIQIRKENEERKKQNGSNHNI